MKKIMLYFYLIILTFCCQPAKAENFIRAEPISTKSGTYILLVHLYYGMPVNGLSFPSIKSVKIVYSTTDVHGNQTVASGSLFIPLIDSLSTFPVISWQHGTEYDKSAVSSNNRGEAIVGYLMASHGYLVTMPDYLGMGDNEAIHPYHHWESEATASIDLIRASREYLNDSLNLTDNGQLFISGYSQGGHATMAIHKYVQDNGLYSEFNIQASAPMSGAYDLSGAQFDLIFNDRSYYYRSEFIPYILGSYQEVYGTICDSLSQLYIAPYDDVIGHLLSGSHTWAEWDEALPENYNEFIQDSVLNNILADKSRTLHPINIAMRRNNLYNWLPQRPVRMLYCGSDSMVSPRNSIVTLDTMVALGASDIEAINIDQAGVHETCHIPSIIYAINWFDSLKVNGNVSSITPVSDVVDPIKVYISPDNQRLCIDYAGKLELSFYSIDGTLRLRKNTGINDSVDLSLLPPGMYIISANDPLTGIKASFQFIRF